MLLLAILPSAMDGRIRFRRHSHSRAVSNRQRLTVNTLITDRGTFEWEWYGVVQHSGGFFIPAVWKVTPGRERGFWSRTELSASFDALAGVDNGQRNLLHASDHLTFAATTALPSLGPLQVAFAPTATALLRGDHGMRAGGTLLTKLDNKRHQGGFSVSWSGATRPSDTNPAGTLDAGAGYGVRLARYGFASRLTPHSNIVWERSTGVSALVTFAEGMEYQANDRFSVDVTVQHLNVRSNIADTQLVSGFTWNLGAVRRRGDH